MIVPQEVIKMINIIRDHNLEEKVNYFMGVCCESRIDQLDENRVFKFFFKNLVNEKDRKGLRKHVREFLREIKPGIKSKIYAKDLYKACQRNDNIKQVIEKNI